MSGVARISTMAELDTSLTEMSRTGGNPAAFEDAVRSLASSLDMALGWRALLKLARVGAESYPVFPVIPSPVPPMFDGRSTSELPAVPRRARIDAPRREPLDDESVLDYGRYLAEHLASWVTAQGIEVSADDLSVAPGYVALLAREDFRREVGWERSLDAHAIMMLTTERIFRLAGGLDLAAPVEEAFFRWLHLASYAEVTPEHLREMLARREIRRRHEEQPTSEVAVMVCETSLVDRFPYEALTDYVAAGGPLTVEQVRGSFRELAERGDDDVEEWDARARGFEDTGELDLSPATEHGRPGLDAYAAGHLLRWMLDRDVPVGPLRLGAWGYYAAWVTDTLVFAPARHGKEKFAAPVAHNVTLRMMRKKNGSVPMAEELFLLAWLMAQTKQAIRLEVWLEQRDKWLAEP